MWCIYSLKDYRVHTQTPGSQQIPAHRLADSNVSAFTTFHPHILNTMTAHLLNWSVTNSLGCVDLHHLILWHHKLLSHLEAFPFLLPGLDLAGIERPLVQMVLLLLLLREELFING